MQIIWIAKILCQSEVVNTGNIDIQSGRPSDQQNF
jgi:hypothetical protein